MRCPECRKKNAAKAKYCARCGMELPIPIASASSSSRLPWMIVGILIAGMFAIAIGVTDPNRTAETPSGTTNFSVATLAVAGNFSCACGSCDDPDLQTCECPVALEEKSYIAAQLGAGTSVDEIIAHIQKKYGGLLKGR